MENNIKVAVRIRPQLPKEKIDMCDVCTRVCPDAPQIFLGKEKAFTFDHVFDMESTQEDIYALCVDNLVEGCFDGYNATVLAYGQTGSGKTFTMGTGLELVGNPMTKGIIPRAVDHLFDGVKSRQQAAQSKGQPVPQFTITAQFLELYNEDIIDLLCQTKSNGQDIRIREDAHSGNVYVVGVSSHSVQSAEETAQKLRMGALSRTTGSTQMNAQSSRSHAIFTLHIKQTRVVPVEGDTGGEQEIESLTAKFHFVDLAGSERLKRTGATGDRAKEGIAINTGLLSLGNVISALGDKTKRATHVPYRDSKLTRFLQDSLGGNSRTLMIACISPSDRDFVETLNTLRYANRAKNITNMIVVNQDKSSQVISALRRQIQQLELELMEYKQGKRLITEDGGEVVNDMYHENTMLSNELDRLKTRIKVLEESNSSLNQTVILLKTQRDTAAWTSSGGGKDISEIVNKYLTEVEELRIKLIESEETACELRRQIARMKASPSKRMSGGFLCSPFSPFGNNHTIVAGEDEMQTEEVLKMAKKDVQNLKKKARRELKFNGNHGADQMQSSNTSAQVDPNGNDVQMQMNGVDVPASSDIEDRTSPEESLSDEEEDLDEDDDDDADTASTTQTQLELYNLTGEIAVKEKLIAELEKSQRKLANLQKHYEEKLAQLQHQISQIEEERDSVLAKLSSSTGSAADNKKKKELLESHEKKLQSLQSQLNKYQAAKKEHEKSMRANAQREQQMKQLRNEVQEMKRQKVNLLAVMKEEQKKRREEGARYNKRIAQLSKQERMKDVQIRSLESAKKKAEAMLRRKDEEVKTLKNRVKPMSDKVAGRAGSLTNISRRNGNATSSFKVPAVPPANSRLPVKQETVPFNPRAAKLRWTQLEKHINTIVINKTTLSQHEAQMEKYLHEKQSVTQALAKTQRRMDQCLREKRSREVISDLQTEIENYQDHLSYLKNNIDDCRDAIVQLEEAINEAVDFGPVVSCTNSQESDFIVNKCLHMLLEKSIKLAMTEVETKEKDVRLEELNNSRMVQDEVLHHVLETSHMENAVTPGGSVYVVDDPVDHNPLINGVNHHQYNERNQTTRDVYHHHLPPVHSSRQNHTSIRHSPQIPRRNNTINNSNHAGHFNHPSLSCPTGNDDDFDSYSTFSHASPTKRDKSRKVTMTASELQNDISNPFNCAMFMDKTDDSMTKSLMNPSSNSTELHRAPSAPSLKERGLRFEPSPSLTRKVYDRNMLLEQTRRMNKTTTNLAAVVNPSLLLHPPSSSPSYHASSMTSSMSGTFSPSSLTSSSSNTYPMDLPDTTPPASPSMMRKNRDENVFSRLTSGTTTSSVVQPDRGMIAPFTGKAQYDKGSPLICTHIAEGHSRAVLSVSATNDVLFTGSKDCTVKIWDLHTGREIQSLVDHPDSVTIVRYNEYSRLAFSVSKSYIKVWDPRENPARCIKTLSSSGLTQTGISSTQSQVGKSNELAHGETRIFDIRLSPYGSTLFSTAGQIVRFWDLRMFFCVGKLNTGHQSNITCMAVEESGVENNLVVTGSKDHYIKLFEVMDGQGGIHNPRSTLTPPHYDGIESLCIHSDSLFSASRDACIKKWDLSNQRLVHSVNQAHRDWIQSLAVLPNSNTLISGCRQGFLKLWSTENCSLLGDIKAHTQAINCIDTNSALVFTASGDNTIGLWTKRCNDSPDVSD